MKLPSQVPHPLAAQGREQLDGPVVVDGDCCRARCVHEVIFEKTIKVTKARAFVKHVDVFTPVCGAQRQVEPALSDCQGKLAIDLG